MMSDDALATFLILISAVFHAGSNVLIKPAEDKFAMRAILLGTCGLIAFPFIFFVPLPTAEVWQLLALSIAIHFVYDLCLVNAYRFGDFSLVYPVLRGIAPVLTAIGAYLFLSETLSSFEIVALAVLATGILLFAAERAISPSLLRQARTALLFAVATGVTIALYTLVDATAMRTVDNAWTYIAWLFFIDGIVFPLFVAVRRRQTLLIAIKTHAKAGVLSGILGFISFTLALLALRFGQTAEVAALRETSVVFGAAMGAFLLGERFGRRRIFAALIIAAGAVALKAT